MTLESTGGSLTAAACGLLVATLLLAGCGGGSRRGLPAQQQANRAEVKTLLAVMIGEDKRVKASSGGMEVTETLEREAQEISALPVPPSMIAAKRRYAAALQAFAAPSTPRRFAAAEAGARSAEVQLGRALEACSRRSYAC